MLEKWLAETIGVQKGEIKLGLDRCRKVAEKLDLIHWEIPVVVVAGTNGKGSVLAALDGIYAAARFRRLLYTSPHIHRFNERISKNGIPVSDEEFMAAIAVIDKAREGIELTFFEWATLAALWVAKTAVLDVLLLEVGLGGRLDTVNIVESDLAIITSIALDHMEFLGDTRELIGAEKAGILRAHKPAIYGDPDMPASVAQKASELGVCMHRFGSEYSLIETGDGWFWKNDSGAKLAGKKLFHLKDQNVATALQAAYMLQDRLPVSDGAMLKAVDGLKVLGRVESKEIAGRVFVFDVAHNPQATEFLAESVRAMKPCAGRSWAIFGALGSKDVAGMLQPLLEAVDCWLVPQLVDFRASDLSELKAHFETCSAKEVRYFDSTQAAVSQFFEHSSAGDRCLVFGSFVTVGSVQADMEKYQSEDLE